MVRRVHRIVDESSPHACGSFAGIDFATVAQEIILRVQTWVFTILFTCKNRGLLCTVL